MLPTPSHRRPGFTLVELLVVISIISILIALGASATVRVIDVQRGNNSEQTVKVVSEHLDRHWQAVIDKAREERIPDLVLAKGNGDAKIARVIWIKLRLRQEFPMTFEEARNFAMTGVQELAPIPAYVNALRDVVPGVRTSESSVCLLLALQQSRSGITFDADRLGSGAITDADARGTTPIGNQNAQSLKQIMDGFSNPIRFFRWPAENREINPFAGPLQGHEGFKDPCDPEGYLANRAWLQTQRGWFEAVLHRLPDPPPSGPPRSFKLFPVVVSAGRNGVTAFQGRHMQEGTGEQDKDNIYSHRLRFGARGD